LYKLLRSKLSDDWPRYIKFVVDALNERPLKRIGYLKPSEINSIEDNQKVFLAWQKHNLPVFEEPGWKEQQKNEMAYQKNSETLKVGDYVYKDNKTSVFNKSFAFQVKILKNSKFVGKTKDFFTFFFKHEREARRKKRKLKAAFVNLTFREWLYILIFFA